MKSENIYQELADAEAQREPANRNHAERRTLVRRHLRGGRIAVFTINPKHYARVGIAHGAFQGPIKIKAGRVMIYAPQHPNRGKDNYVLAYRLIMERILGRPLFKQEHVHHINGNPADDRQENLQLLSCSEHISFHRKLHGKWSKRFDFCVKCGGVQRKHRGFGLCRRCYKKWRYVNE